MIFIIIIAECTTVKNVNMNLLVDVLTLDLKREEFHACHHAGKDPMPQERQVPRVKSFRTVVGRHAGNLMNACLL